jgi:hypothetical protein
MKHVLVPAGVAEAANFLYTYLPPFYFRAGAWWLN